MDNTEGNGDVAVPAKLLNDTLKEFPEQPLTFQINARNILPLIFIRKMVSSALLAKMVTIFRSLPELKEEAAATIEVNHDVLAERDRKNIVCHSRR